MKFIFPLVLISLLCISFFSCGKDDNPITPNLIDTTLDSPRFNWKTFYVYDEGFFNGIWARDTNDILVLNMFYSYTARIKDNTLNITKYFPLNPFGLGGFDNNTGYLLGIINGDTAKILRVKKWNGSSFQDFALKNTYGIDPSKCFFHKPNEIWIAENNGYINRFDGTGLQRYSFIAQNDSGWVQNIYFDSTAQKVRMSYLVTSEFTGNSVRTFYLFEFNGSAWNKINEFTYTDLNVTNFFINGYMFNENGRNINILNNTFFTQFQTLHGFTLNHGGGGYSKNNLMVSGSLMPEEPLNPYHLFHWNGSKWSKEYIGFPLLQAQIYAINSDFYVATDNSGNPSSIVIGTKK
ncbi:MAG: hypothetical protein JST55_07125 [Bacteroidetes bacterium]|nr:hypothetical protein [Bacteroidota bacterium]